MESNSVILVNYTPSKGLVVDLLLVLLLLKDKTPVFVFFAISESCFCSNKENFAFPPKRLDLQMSLASLARGIF